MGFYGAQNVRFANEFDTIWCFGRMMGMSDGRIKIEMAVGLELGSSGDTECLGR